MYNTQQLILLSRQGWSKIDREGTGFVQIRELAILAKYLPSSVIGIEVGKKPTLKEQVCSNYKLSHFGTCCAVYAMGWAGVTVAVSYPVVHLAAFSSPPFPPLSPNPPTPPH